MAQILPGGPHNPPNVSTRQIEREFVSRVRQRRPGYDQVDSLVQGYQRLSLNTQETMPHEELIKKFIIPAFQALGWHVREAPSIQGKPRSYGADLVLEYQDVRIFVEVKSPTARLDRKIYEQLRSYTLQADGCWGIVTNFESIQIWDFKKSELVLESSLTRYIIDDTPEDDLLAAEVFCEQIAKHSPNRMTVADAFAPLEQLQKKAITPEQALDSALSISDSGQRGAVLVELMMVLPERLLAEALPQILPTIREMPAGTATRARAFIVFLSHLPHARRGEVAREAILAAREIETDTERASILTRLAALLPDSMRMDILSEAMSATQLIKDVEARARALVEVIPLAPDALREDVVLEALIAVQAIEDEQARAEILGRLAPSLPATLRLDAWRIADKIRDKRIRQQALSNWPAGFPPDDSRPVDPLLAPANLHAPEPIERVNQIDTRALADVRSKEDQLNFKPYAKAISDFIKHPNTGKPLTIAIDAPWGMGKTSLMHFIEDEFKERRRPRWLRRLWAKLRKQASPDQEVPAYPTVWFNAWKYSREESLWAALVLEILNQIRGQYPWYRRLRLALTLNRKRFDVALLLRNVIKMMTYVMGIGLILVLVFQVLPQLFSGPAKDFLTQLWDYVKAIGAVSGLAAVLYAAGRDIFKNLIGPFDLKIGQYVQEPNYQERVGFLATFSADYKRVVEAVTYNGRKPLIVFIDDLDRCPPPKPTEVIEAINMLLDTEYCVFVIGMDSRAVAASIEAKYKALNEYLFEPADSSKLLLGYHFLEKIVQFNFRVPRASNDAISKFIQMNLGASRKPAQPEPTTAEITQAEQQIQQQLDEGKSLDEAVDTAKAKAVESGSASASVAVEEAHQRYFVTTFDDSAIVQQAIRKAADHLDFNPRKIKRFINYFRLQALIASRLGKVESGEIQLDRLADWLLITMRWPGVLKDLMENHELINELKRIHEVHRHLHQTDCDVEVIKRYDAGISPRLKAWCEDDDLIDLLTEVTQKSAGAWSTYFDLTQTTAGSQMMSEVIPQ